MMERNNEWLTRAECSAMRGMAIMAIMLHNYCHWLAPAVKENEYLYHEANNDRLLDTLTHPSDMPAVLQLVSYFGHYGVPVFLFLSGFGLVLKYERSDNRTPATEFLRSHFVKLFTMMVAGFAAFTAIDAITPGAHHYRFSDIVAQMLMYINMLPRPDKIIWPGPYWFFGLMMQLYIVYRLAIYRRHWGVMAVLVALCWFVQTLCCDSPEGDTLNRLRYNCIGGMMPFCAGVLAARVRPSAAVCRMSRWQWALAAVVTCAVLFFFCFNFHTWLWVPLLVIVAGAATVKALPGRALVPLTWTGALSAVIFVIHPIFRKIFIPISHRGDICTGVLLYVVATLTTAWMIGRVTRTRK